MPHLWAVWLGRAQFNQLLDLQAAATLGQSLHWAILLFGQTIGFSRCPLQKENYSFPVIVFLKRNSTEKRLKLNFWAKVQAGKSRSKTSSKQESIVSTI